MAACIIDFLGVKEDIKHILDSGGFLRDVEKHLRRKYPNFRGISKRSIHRYCQQHGLRRFLTRKLDKEAKERAIRKAAKEVRMQKSDVYFSERELLMEFLCLVFVFEITRFDFILFNYCWGCMWCHELQQDIQFLINRHPLFVHPKSQPLLYLFIFMGMDETQ